MRLEVFYLDFSHVPAVAVRWHEFELARVSDQVFHAGGTLVVEHVLRGDNLCTSQALEQGEVSALHFGVFSARHWFDEDCTAVDFDHNHEILVATDQFDRKFACLVGVDGPSCFDDFDI